MPLDVWLIVTMDVDEAIALANAILLSQAGRPLSDLERHVLRGSLAGKSYEAMADGWAARTVKDAGSRLWKYISKALGNNVKVNKANFQGALIQLSQRPHYRTNDQKPSNGVVVNGTQRVEGWVENRVRLPQSLTTFQNPFGDRGRITDPARFFNRDELRWQIYAGLSQGCSQSLIGESQVGKSSLLSMICSEGPKHLPLCQFILLDMQCIANEADFFAALCEALELPAPCRGFELKRRLRGKQYVLCLDEIERMTHPDDFSGRERTELRGLSEGAYSPLTLVIASRSPLALLFPDTPEVTSPLAGICNQIIVNPFSVQTARSFIEHRLQGTDITFTDSDVGQLIEQSEGNPGQLQRLATELYHREIHRKTQKTRVVHDE